MQKQFILSLPCNSISKFILNIYFFRKETQIVRINPNQYQKQKEIISNTGLNVPTDKPKTRIFNYLFQNKCLYIQY